MLKLKRFIALSLIIAGFLIRPNKANSASEIIKEVDTTDRALKYIPILATELPGENEPEDPSYQILTVRAFDRKHKNYKNAVAVAGKKFYIFNEKGVQVYVSPNIFKNAVRQTKIAKLRKDGYYDTVVVAEFICGPMLKCFDRLGTHLSTIPTGEKFGAIDVITFLLKDLNGDGVDELITNGLAFYTKDEGMTWEILWQIDELKRRTYKDKLTHKNEEDAARLFVGSDLERENGFVCYYHGDIVAVSGKGEILFKRKIYQETRVGSFPPFPFTTGDFNGDGLKDETVVIDGNTDKIMFLDNTGNIFSIFPLDANIIPPEESRGCFIKSGSLGSNNTDAIIIGSETGVIVAYDVNGNKLWQYISQNRKGIGNLFITDLDSDGRNEVIAGVGKKIVVLSNQGVLIDELAVDGDIGGYFFYWGSNNPMMDIADLNNDGYQEIIAVTNKGSLYIFANHANKP